MELQVAYEKLNDFFADYTRNISRGGTFIPTRRSVPLGTRFRFRLRVPGQGVPFELDGVVVRNGSDGGEPGVGVSFQWSDPERRQRFEAAVEALLAASFGPSLARSLLERGDGEGH